MQPRSSALRGSCWAPGQGLSSSSAPLQAGADERKSELLPAGWEANKEVYTLRYKSTDDARELLLKAITVEDSMILNVMVSTHVSLWVWGAWAEKNTRGNFLNVGFCLFCLEVVSVPQDGADPGGGFVSDVAQHEAGQTLAVSGQWAVGLEHSSTGAALLLSLSQPRTSLQPSTSSCSRWLCSVFHPLQPELGRGSRENLAVHWGLLLGIQAQHRDMAGSR